MKLVSALRIPYRSGSIVRSGATDMMDDTRLRRAAVLTQVVLLVLCAARVEVDRVRGPLTIEGSMALALFVVFAMSLLAKAVGWLARGARPTDKHHLSPTPTLTLVRATHGRAS